MIPTVVPSTNAMEKPITRCLIVAQTFTQKSPDRTISHISRITSVGDGSTKGSKKYAASTAQMPMKTT